MADRHPYQAQPYRMLLYEIDNLFGRVKKPERHRLGALGTGEWACTLDHLHTKTWHQVTLEDFDSQDGVAGTINVLSMLGFTYFLPGLLRVTLTTADDDERHVIVSALVDVFTRPDYLEPDLENTAKLKALSPEQRGWLIRFMEDMQGRLLTLCPIVVNAAIASLKAGEIISYTQKALDEWATKQIAALNQSSKKHKALPDSP